MDIQVNISIKDETIITLISDMLIGANYWAYVKDSCLDTLYNSYPELRGKYYEETIFNWIKNGGIIVIVDEEAEAEYSVGLPEIKNAIALIVELFPQHFLDIVTENDDATTGDVFLQCCCFPEQIRKDKDLIYG